MSTQNEKKREDDKKKNGPQSTIKKAATKNAGTDAKKDNARRK